jgi:hypothetical protein
LAGAAVTAWRLMAQWLMAATAGGAMELDL